MLALRGKVYLDMKACQGKKHKAQKVDAIIGQNLRDFRLLKGLSQQEMGNKVGVTFQQIQKYEKGTNRISAARLLQFSQILEVQISNFFGPSYDSNSSHFKEIDSEVLKLLRSLSQINDKELLKQIGNMLRSISKVNSES